MRYLAKAKCEKDSLANLSCCHLDCSSGDLTVIIYKTIKMYRFIFISIEIEICIQVRIFSHFHRMNIPIVYLTVAVVAVTMMLVKTIGELNPVMMFTLKSLFVAILGTTTAILSLYLRNLILDPVNVLASTDDRRSTEHENHDEPGRIPPFGAAAGADLRSPYGTDNIIKVAKSFRLAPGRLLVYDPHSDKFLIRTIHHATNETKAASRCNK